ncbi:MAG: hypothetical protein HFH14_00370 [Lachnospiraceae bacterium]|nr:hypothetical protein [Lachnospiraceae bacterium]
MYKKTKKALAVLITGIVFVHSLNYPTAQSAKIKLSKTKLNIKTGKSKTLKASGLKKVKWSVNKPSVAKLSAKKKTSVKITGKKAGSATVTAKYTVRKKTKKLSCKITVTDGRKITNASPTPVRTAAPAAETPMNNPTNTPVNTPCITPGPTPVPTPLPTPSVISENGTWAYIPFEDDTLLKEYETIFGNVGTCLTYKGVFGKNEMQDTKTMNFVQKNYNSFTLENEMKPSYMLADSDKDFRNPPFNKLLDIHEAVAAGYTIPDGYKEATVPSINFERIDTILSTAAKYGIRMRAHTLIWHSQTPTEFFRTGYKESGAFVTPEVMDQRIIYYVTNVMKHVLDSEYSSVVYTWDVVNEYFHQLSDGTEKNWSNIYDINGISGLTSRPSYVKLSFKTAYDVLKSYGLNDKVTLFYNDYNTSQVSEKIVDMVNYINEKDEINPEGERICSGVGMQCHLDVKWPSVKEQLNTVKKFLDAGFEVQITELDIINSLNEKDEETLCDYWFNFMKGLVEFKKAGGNITGVTFWGLSDAVTWRFGKSALLYGESINDPKKSLYAVYAAAQTWLDLK